MKTIKVTFSNGDTITTSINGTREEVSAYYMGQTFYLGAEENEIPSKAISIQYLAD
jgi:hypothetical protein